MTKLVQLSEEAYRRLRMAKRGQESFSDVILRTFPSGDLANLANMKFRENLEWYDRWQKKIDAMDRPRA